MLFNKKEKKKEKKKRWRQTTVKWDDRLEQLILCLSGLYTCFFFYYILILFHQLKRTCLHLSKVGDRRRERPEDSLFNSYYIGVEEDTTPFPGLLHFTLDTYLILQGIKQGGIKYHFWSLWYMTRFGIDPSSPRPLANTLPTSVFFGGVCVCVCVRERNCDV